MQNKRIYAAYGSNINLEQMARRCPNSKIIGTAMIENFELEFRRVATIVPKEGSQVPVLLWELSPQDEKNLDRYEGYPNHYRKENFNVKVGDTVCKGMAYVMNYGQISMPPTAYYNGIFEGYKANGMDTKYLVTALENAYSAQFEDLDEDESLDEDSAMKLE